MSAASKTAKKPWPSDPPDGFCWACPDCESWATIGGNAGFHRDQNKHGEPRCVKLRRIGSTDIMEPVIRRHRPNQPIKPDWKEIALAYEEAAEHLDMAAGELHAEEDAEQKAAFKLVAARIRAAGNRVKPLGK